MFGRVDAFLKINIGFGKFAVPSFKALGMSDNILIPGIHYELGGAMVTSSALRIMR